MSKGEFTQEFPFPHLHVVGYERNVKLTSFIVTLVKRAEQEYKKHVGSFQSTDTNASTYLRASSTE
jgi:hypothetical protein